MKRILLCLALFACLAVPALAATDSSVSFGYSGLTVASSQETGRPLAAVAAGLSFGLPGKVGSLDLEGARSDAFTIFTVDLAPMAGRFIYFPFGASYLDIGGGGEYGANAGIGLKMFPSQHLGLKFSAKVHHLQHEIAGQQNYVDGRAVVVLAF